MGCAVWLKIDLLFIYEVFPKGRFAQFCGLCQQSNFLPITQLGLNDLRVEHLPVQFFYSFYDHDDDVTVMTCHDLVSLDFIGEDVMSLTTQPPNTAGGCNLNRV